MHCRLDLLLAWVSSESLYQKMVDIKVSSCSVYAHIHQAGTSTAYAAYEGLLTREMAIAEMKMDVQVSISSIKRAGGHNQAVSEFWRCQGLWGQAHALSMA